MRRTALAFALALAACGQTTAPPPLPETAQQANAAPPPWFICDATDAPVLLVFNRNGDTIDVVQYDKPNGALIARTQYQAGLDDAAMGSVHTALMQNGVEAGSVRHTNPGMLETPGAAYTPRFTGVRLGERDISCRWLPRTRVMGFTGRRSFVVHEDADGDLIYTTYDFASAANARPIELSENGESSTFSVEVRGGEETTPADGVDFSFSGDGGFIYLLTLNRNGTGELAVERNGAPVQSEPLVAFQQGSGPE